MVDFDRSDMSRQIMLPIKQKSFYGNIETIERKYEIDFTDLLIGNGQNYLRYAYYYYFLEEYNKLYNTTTVTEDSYNNAGRLTGSVTRTHHGLNPNQNNWMHSETNTYNYQTVTLNGYQKKTVPTKILTKQQYGTNGNVITDTLSFGYYPASGKGRLAWMRKGNIHGVITLKYENYTSAGLYEKKTVVSGNDSRAEIYNYDATQRFITKITNPLNHSATFSYNARTGNKTSETDPNGQITTYLYDTFGNLTQINYPDNTKTDISINWHSGSTPPNAKYYTSTTSSGKPVVEIYYDILGREVCRKDDGYYYQTIYNNKGQVDKTSGPFANFDETGIIWHSYTYDGYGRKQTEKAPYIDLVYSCPFGSRKVTITDKLRNNTQSWKVYDALGRITEAKDESGTITYNYSVTNLNQHMYIISAVGATTTILFDLWGNRLSIDDPDAGLITSYYNKFNELEKQIDARGNITTYQYDVLGRIEASPATSTTRSSRLST